MIPKTRSGPFVVLLATALLSSLPGATLRANEASTPVLTTPHFAFHSDFATNLNDALLVAGSARNAGEAAIAPRLAELYQVAWHGLPLRVDTVETAPSLGASTTIHSPAGGHVLVNTSVLQGDRAFETVFHEGSHTLMDLRRPDPVPKALADAAQELGVPLPRDLWHVVLFYTTGETVRRALEEGDHPGYTPYLYAFEHFGTGEWGRLRDAIEIVWPAYVEGKRGLDEAARELVQALASS